MPLKGSPQTLKGLANALRAMPKTVAAEVARQGAPAITGLAQAAYDGGTTVYGDARPEGVNGPLTLVKSGDARRGVKFVAVGTQLRCVLGEKYVRYLIGKYRVLPNIALPSSWKAELNRVVAGVKGPAL